MVYVGMCTTAHVGPPGAQLATAMYENFGDYTNQVSLINSPQPVTVESGTNATFSVLVSSASTVIYNGATNVFATYQWYSVIGGVTNLIPGATASTYTTPFLTTNLNGEKVYCAISAIGASTATTNSATATLTVTENHTVPTIVSAFGEYDSGTLMQYVDVTFSELMDMASILNTTNYSIADNTITAAMLFTNNEGVGDPTNVILQLGTQLTGGFTLLVSNKVQSFSGIPIAATNTSIHTTVDPLSSIDIGIMATTITTNGTTYYEEPDTYLVNASGNDIWNDQDGFRFIYTTRTNNFNVVVQVPWLLPADTWSKAGLMAREFIDPATGGSRFVDVVTTALTNQLALDGSYGTGTLSFGMRATNGGGAYEEGLPDYLGDYVIAPSYPNQWLLLTRVTDGTNDLFTAYVSTNEADWTWFGEFNPVTSGADTPFPPMVYVGMCTTAHVGPPSAQLATAMYENFGDYVGDKVSVISPPKSVTNVSGTSATFSVLVSSASTVIYNGATNPFVTYQWYTNSVAVPGATADIYTTPFLTTNLNGEKVYCAITAIGGTPSNSATATLTVLEDTVPPTIVSAFGEYDSSTAKQYVDVTFNKLMNVASLLNSTNYSISIGGYTITNVMLFTNDLGVSPTNMVILQLNKRLTGSFTLNVTNVQSFFGTSIAATNVPGTLDPLSSINIGVIAPVGATYYEEPGSYEVDASGQDIWNTLDGFRYVYTTRTNDFDVVVQVPWIISSDTWCKAGLMAREKIDPANGGSRMVAVVTTAASDQLALDGSGGGQNTLQMIVRDTHAGGAYETLDYIGDYMIAPSYPNQWLRLTRVIEGTNDLFTAYASTNETDWTWMGDFNPVTTGEGTPFPSVVNVGMCTTAHISTPTGSLPDTNTMLVTAMYENFGDYVAGPILTATLVAVSNSVTISWTPAVGSLYSSPVLGSGATWTLLTNTSPAAIPITKTSQSMFFKVK
jgi:hypothetical protein